MSMVRKARTAALLFHGDRAGFYQRIGLGRPSDSLHRIAWRDALAYRYFRRSGLSRYFDELPRERTSEGFALFLSPHKVWDIVNLHRLAIRGHTRTILEFGCGVSTIALADAAKRTGGTVRVVEASAEWARIVADRLEALDLVRYVTFTIAAPRLQLLNGQLCHVFDQLPDVRPDMIYLDGPNPTHIEGTVHGLTRQTTEMVVAADPLLYEWAIYPGFVMVIDGRFNNVQFLKANLRRRYRVHTNAIRNVTVFRLIA